jgi:hypothetical protein
MAWADVAAKINFWAPGGPSIINGVSVSTENSGAFYNGASAFSPEDRAKILENLEQLYDGSPTARALLEKGAAAGSLWLVNITGNPLGSYASPNSGTVGVDLNQITNFQWMGRDGQFQTERLGGNIIHELIHAIDGTLDLVDPVTGAALGRIRPYNDPNFDHLGLTVQKQNQIFQEMDWGYGYWQVGYDAALDVNPRLLRTDVSYSFGDSIAIAYFDSAANATPDDLDLSNRRDESNDLIIGFGGNDTIRGGAGRDYLYGSIGDDTISGGSGNNFIDGGDRVTPIPADGIDAVDYSIGDFGLAPDHGVTVEVDLSKSTIVDGAKTILVSDNGYGATDTLLSIEKFKLSPHADIVRVAKDSAQLLAPLKEIDAGGQDNGGRDILDLSQWGSGVEFTDGKIKGYQTDFKNFEKLIFTASNDKVDLHDRSDTRGIQVDLGVGDDTLVRAPQAAVIYTGAGHDNIWITNNAGIADLSADDRISIGGIFQFHGGLRYKWSESPWAISNSGLFKSGIDKDGELQVQVDGLGTLYVLNWQASGGMSAPVAQRPGQISLFEFDIGAYRLLDPNKPSNMTILGTWELYGATVKANFGVQVWKGLDPLVLDLDGNGFDLTQQSTISPLYDIDGDGYAERTAWVKPGDGILARDLDHNGRIDDVTEMFGGATAGFTALARLDGNHDGQVDAGDNGLADFNGDGGVDASDTVDSLMVWRDLDEDTVTDAGELFSLADLGIASISVQSAAQDHVLVNGNQIEATGTFTRTDGTTGTAGDVLLHIDNVQTRYTGGPIAITPQAAALPDHRGFGTLVSLREAMSLDAGFAATVANTLPQLSSLSLDELRAAALPILTGWAVASPLGDGDRDPNTSAPKLRSHNDVPVLVAPGAYGKQEVVDFAYETWVTKHDENGNPYVIHYWALASGASVKDASEEFFDRRASQTGRRSDKHKVRWRSDRASQWRVRVGMVAPG